MRPALTLIELILSMVIIGIVFTVIPKLILSMNQGAQTTLKEEAMFNALTQIGAIIRLPWDQNNTAYTQILIADTPAVECNTTTGYRIGGFVGSRHCREENGILPKASPIAKEDSSYNDIDDFDGNITITTSPCSAALYQLNTSVRYVASDGSPAAAGVSTDAKTIGVKVRYSSTHKLAPTANCIADLNYTAYNIGLIHINSREW